MGRDADRRCGRLDAGGGIAANLVNIGVRAFSDIARARWGQPPAGTYVQTGPGGSTYYRQPEGSSALAFPGANIGIGGSGGTLLLILLGVGALFLFASMRSRSK